MRLAEIVQNAQHPMTDRKVQMQRYANGRNVGEPCDTETFWSPDTGTTPSHVSGTLRVDMF